MKKKNGRRVRDMLSHLLGSRPRAVCVLCLCACVCAVASLMIAQEPKAPATQPATGKSGSDPLSKSKGGTRERSGQTAAAADDAAAASTTSSAAPAALDPAKRTFVVDTDLTTVAIANGVECNLTPGDVVTRLTDAPDADNEVKASVSASKKGDCAAGATVAVKVDDLQEMYNQFQEQIAAGMGELAKKQGTNGVPKAPDTAAAASDERAPDVEAVRKAIKKTRAKAAAEDPKKAPKKKTVKPGSESNAPK